METHPNEDPQLAFVDLYGEVWSITYGWLLFKFAEGPDGMPFFKERKFERRRYGMLRRVIGGGLEGFDEINGGSRTLMGFQNPRRI